MLCSISKSRGTINLFPYVLAVASSCLFASEAFICNFMHFTAFHFSYAVFHRSWYHANTSKSSTPNISFPSDLTTNFLMIALPMLLTNILIGSTIEDNSMLKDRFIVPGMVTSSLPKFRSLTRSNWFWSISLGLCMMITFFLVLFMPLVILREWPGFNYLPYSTFGVSPDGKNYGHPWTIGYTVALLVCYSQG